MMKGTRRAAVGGVLSCLLLFCLLSHGVAPFATNDKPDDPLIKGLAAGRINQAPFGVSSVNERDFAASVAKLSRVQRNHFMALSGCNARSKLGSGPIKFNWFMIQRSPLIRGGIHERSVFIE
jgi:hypothetical protein